MSLSAKNRRSAVVLDGLQEAESGSSEIQIASPVPDISNNEPTVCNGALFSTKGALVASCYLPPIQ